MAGGSEMHESECSFVPWCVQLETCVLLGLDNFVSCGALERSVGCKRVLVGASLGGSSQRTYSGRGWPWAVFCFSVCRLLLTLFSCRVFFMCFLLRQLGVGLLGWEAERCSFRVESQAAVMNWHTKPDVVAAFLRISQ